MAINRSNIAAQDITQNHDISIRLLSSKPDVREYLETPVTPNLLCGYFNDATDTVELYLTDGTGRRYIKVK